ncbi:hypothetical protein DACRYDRAFT_45233 [Dacryopinax primogenitus]|uniref:RFX-type winged-helix domain-containing protein n=1 Tax=Dacryopinax primogenitus (strain DJM 731) TaxID=1858805 RepID=M5G7J2_DACPD|nr:uncharacterized protein DACRYDRAFT_45233 [Dacryopinax primogenitus]EJU06176.1 hypothetical protein DACRYDRAFT_45233 [Dacryopinax primogenitus]
MGPEQTLEELAQAVRNATTTSASDRAKQSFVQLWLTSNYQVYPDGNVPRQGLYMSYRRVCEEYQIPHINTATLGKAIRLCFPNIKTRRLGVRGNSKYHYCGIRPTNASEAEWLQRYATTSQGWDISALPGRPSSSGRAMGGGGQYGHSEEEEDEESDETDNDGMGQSLTIRKGHPHFATYGEMDDRTPTTGALMHQQQQSRPVTGTGQFSANPSPSPLSASPQPPQGPFSASTLPPSVRQINGFPDISEALGPQTGPPTPESLVAQEMWTLFIGHLDSLLDAVRQLRFDQFELNIRAFWTGLGPQHREVVHVPTVQALMARADALVYDEILESLRAQIFMPLPPTAMQQMKQMADKMEKILLSAVEGYQANFYESKIELGARFGHLVTRFLDMFQVAQALRSVLTNQKQILDMQTAWQQIDFDSVRNQTALVCNCRHEVLVQILETEFPQLLANLYTAPEPVKTVTEWVDDTYRRIMQGDFGPIESSQARSVLIRWGFVTSQVMRDLTIRSDPAFGAFQILKLFLDDWIALHVLRDVALSTNSVAASIDPQQQYLNMSPMPGDDNIFPNEYMQPFQAPAQPAAAQPTTSSTMMAALTADNTYPEPLDGSAPGAGFSFPLGTLDFSNLDPQASGGNTVSSNTGVEGLMSAMSSMSSTTAAFPEYSTPGGNSFEVEEYTHDYSMSNVATATPGHPPVPKIEDTTGGGLTSPHSQQRA